MKRNAFQLTMFVLVILALAVSSCKDDDTTGDGTGTGGGGTGTPDANYLPRAINNIWNYSDDSTVEITANSGESWNITNFGPISGISLSLAEALTVQSISVTKDDGDYNVTAILSVVEIIGYEGAANPISYTILKDDVSEGTTWVGELAYVYNYTPTVPLLPAISTPPITIPYTFTIMEKDMTLTVEGTTYEDVIKVNQQFDNAIGGLVSTDIYYAEGVGVIQYGTNDGVTTPTGLTSYDLK